MLLESVVEQCSVGEALYRWIYIIELILYVYKKVIEVHKTTELQKLYFFSIFGIFVVITF